MTQPASRLITLIMLLQSKPNQKAADLAEKLDVSVRTLHRYFSALDDMGIPIYSERGPQGGFSLVRGYKMPPLILSPEEATAVYLGTSLVEEMWGELYRQAGQAAMAKLDNILPDEQRQEIAWARRSLAATGMHRADQRAIDPLLAKLRRAIRENRRVTLLYRSGNNPHPSKREIEPYALVHRWGWWYVVGFCLLRGEKRSFRVDRIIELSLTDQVYHIPEEFDIYTYLKEEFQEQPKILVKIHFIPQAAHVALTNRAYWEELLEQPDGSVIVSFTTPDLGWAASTVLAYGPVVVVLEPPELIRMVRDWVTAIACLYQID